MTAVAVNSAPKSRVIILGGGPAGLALADACGQSRQEFLLLERAKTLGGLAQSVTWKDYGAHDLGPHKIFTLDKDLMARVRGLLPEEQWLTREKKSSIYLGGHFLPYPPSPFSLIRVFGVGRFIGMVTDYGFARVRGLFARNEPGTFEEDLIQRVGRKLYEVLFKPIAEKLWGHGATLDSKLSKGRVQTPKLSEVIGRLLGVKKSSEFEALDFAYPRGGLQQLWDSILRRNSGSGAFLTDSEVKRIVVDGDRVSSIEYVNRDTGESCTLEVSAHDFVFSSLPIKLLAKVLDPGLSAGTKALLDEKVVLNDLLLVFLYVDKTDFLDDSWVFVPDPNILFHRLSEQESFDPGMTPNGSILCCEVMNNDLRATAALDDAELARRCLDGLRAMGYAGFTVKDQRVIRLPQSYPVFRPGFESALTRVLEDLDGIRNFRTIGRQGAFNYIGTLDAMDIGYGSARWFLSGQGQNQEGRRAAAWRTERERTRHYPVLD